MSFSLVHFLTHFYGATFSNGWRHRVSAFSCFNWKIWPGKCCWPIFNNITLTTSCWPIHHFSRCIYFFMDFLKLSFVMSLDVWVVFVLYLHKCIAKNDAEIQIKINVFGLNAVVTWSLWFYFVLYCLSVTNQNILTRFLRSRSVLRSFTNSTQTLTPLWGFKTHVSSYQTHQWLNQCLLISCI